MKITEVKPFSFDFYTFCKISAALGPPLMPAFTQYLRARYLITKKDHSANKPKSELADNLIVFTKFLFPWFEIEIPLTRKVIIS